MNRILKFFIIINLTLLGACSIHQAKPIEGIVIDAFSNEPVQNALVIAEWRLVSGFFHPTQAGVASIQEAVSDAQGQFSIPGWDTKLLLNNLASNAPEIRIYKPGYLLGYFHNGYEFSVDSSLSGATLKLRPYEKDNNVENQVSTLEFLANIFTDRWGKEPCFWEKFLILRQ